MRAYRLVLKAHRSTAFTGDGARLAGGRWNHRGTRVVYCSESRALAALELFVNLDPALCPPDLLVIPVDVPDALVTVARLAALPPGWRRYPAPEATKDFGTRWAASRVSAALVVPSAVMPEERNVLLNPAHPDFPRVKTGRASRFRFDGRMWKGVP